LFFWGFIAVAFVFYATVKDKLYEGVLPLGISSFGLICSWSWHLVNRGSKYWQENWETKVSEYEKKATGTKPFENKAIRQSKKPWSAWKYSVGKVTLFLSLYTTLIWLGLFFNETLRLCIVYDIISSDWVSYLYSPKFKMSILVVFTIASLFFLTFTTYTTSNKKPLWYSNIWSKFLNLFK